MAFIRSGKEEQKLLCIKLKENGRELKEKCKRKESLSDMNRAVQQRMEMEANGFSWRLVGVPANQKTKTLMLVLASANMKTLQTRIKDIDATTVLPCSNPQSMIVCLSPFIDWARMLMANAERKQNAIAELPSMQYCLWSSLIWIDKLLLWQTWLGMYSWLAFWEMIWVAVFVLPQHGAVFFCVGWLPLSSQTGL